MDEIAPSSGDLLHTFAPIFGKQKQGMPASPEALDYSRFNLVKVLQPRLRTKRLSVAFCRTV
jgi:hypothetical protein